MEFKYGNWLPLREMSDFMTADLSDIDLSRDFDSDGGYFYEFEKDGKSYDVNFRGPLTWEEFNAVLAKNKYSITFHGMGTSKILRNTKAPTAVYGEVFKAIRKLIEVANPDALSFYGAHNEQDALYDLFYRRFLSKGFTRVGAENYLRNDLYSKYEQANGLQWQAIKNLEKMEGGIRSGRIQHGMQQRAGARAQRLGKPQAQWQGISGPSHSIQSNSPMQQLNLQRGSRTPQGGIYVGTTPTGIDWVAYDDNQFTAMTQRFDSQYANH